MRKQKLIIDVWARQMQDELESWYNWAWLQGVIAKAHKIIAAIDPQTL